MKRAVIYLRVSTAAQAERDGDPEGYSIPFQRDACLQRVRELGLEVAGEFTDAGESAKSADRPQLRAMLTRLAGGDISAVIVHKIDRLARNIEDHVAIKAVLRRHRCQLISVTENIEETASGKLVEGIHALMAEFYSSNLATEIRKGTIQKAKSGGTPHLAPLGYLNIRKRVEGKELGTIAVDPERAPLVQHAFEAFATGNYTLDSLLSELTARGLRHRSTAKRHARPLSRAQLSNLLHNRYYIGIVNYAGVEYVGRHEPLIGRDLFDQVQAVLLSHNVSGEKQRKHHQYLKGSVFCGRCGSRLCITRARGNGGTYLYFFCNGRHKGTGCLQPYIRVEDLEDAVVDYYAMIQLEPERMDQIRNDIREEMADQRRRGLQETKRQERRLASLSAQRTKLLEAHYADAIPLDLLKLEQERISREVAEAERVLAARQVAFTEIEDTLEKALGLAADCQRAYREAGPQVRRLFNQAFFKKLLVDGGGVRGGELTDGFAELLAEDLVKRIYERRASPAFSGVGSNKRNLVEMTGFEPATSWLQTRRSSD
jgi:site-specific DNA recombinase